MIVYKCVISGDEITSDRYNISNLPDQPLLWKVSSKAKKEEEGEAVLGEEEEPSEGSGSDVDIAEGEESRVIDIVDGPRLQNIESFVKTNLEDFKDAMSGFTDAAKEKIVEGREEFEEGLEGALQYLYDNLQDFEIYVGESMNKEASLGFLNYEEDGVTPFLIIFRHVLEAEEF